MYSALSATAQGLYRNPTALAASKKAINLAMISPPFPRSATEHHHGAFEGRFEEKRLQTKREHLQRVPQSRTPRRSQHRATPVQASRLAHGQSLA
jgi:hypothetical protein